MTTETLVESPIVRPSTTFQTEQQVRAMLRAALPNDIFRRRPWRMALAVLFVGLIVAGTLAICLVPMKWYFLSAISIVLGNLYGSLMFLGHEVGHGAVVGSRRLQDLVMYPACAIFMLSPHLWRTWHNGTHHAHANEPGKDPDNFGTLEEYHTGPWTRRFFYKFAPGSGHWLSVTYLFFFFTLQGQGVLWGDSRDKALYPKFNRRKAAIDSLVMAAFWVGLGLLIGWKASLYAIVIPMLLANVVVLGYIVTNHMLRPMTEDPDTLANTMSVKSPRFFDWMHLNFSHHVEHHLFPGMCSSQYPKVRKLLRDLASERYMAPPHWWALWVLFRTPRIYDGTHALIEPTTGRRVSIAHVDELLADM